MRQKEPFYQQWLPLIKSSLKTCLTPALVLSTVALFLQRRLLLHRKLLDQLHVGEIKCDTDFHQSYRSEEHTSTSNRGHPLLCTARKTFECVEVKTSVLSHHLSCLHSGVSDAHLESHGALLLQHVYSFIKTPPALDGVPI